MEFLTQVIVVCSLVFFAGIVDSIAGGGGLITLPAYALVGVPPKMALGTNKFVSMFGTFIASLRYTKGKKVNYRSAFTAGAFSLIGGVLGSQLAQRLSDEFFSYLMLIILPILFVFILRSKEFKPERKNLTENKKRVIVTSSIIGLCVGTYDGFFGPGTGTFLILLFNGVVGFDVVTSSGNAKVTNLCSNIAAFVSFALGGLVMYKLAIPAMFFSMLGGYVGAELALKKGTKIIKPMLLLVFSLLILSNAFDLFFKNSWKKSEMSI